MIEKTGQPLPLGVTIMGDLINFSVEAKPSRECKLLLYEKGKNIPEIILDMTEELGTVRYLAVSGLDPAEYEYNYLIDGAVTVDPYAKAIAGKETWGEKKEVSNHEIRGRFQKEDYDWGEDRPLEIPYYQVIAYSLHVRGYTMHSSSRVKKKGTFRGLVEKIPYLLDLGINQVHLMPVYEFEECLSYRNYWGYGVGYYYAPKSSYAASKDAVRELKDMVKAFHKAGIEVVLEMPFTGETPKRMIEDCLRYYRMEYHIDGFIVNPLVTPMDSVNTDPILKRTKIMIHDVGFQTTMRRFLKGDEGVVSDVIYWLKRPSAEHQMFNYITNQNGFTLQDLVSYDAKHNEENGEHNQDGPEYNYSWNCGVEGETRKKAVLSLRERQIKNAYALVLLAQGTPCILAGDEFGNTQKGNNNVYCQDNPVAWLDWKKLEKQKDLHNYVKKLIALRKAHPVFCPEKEFLGIDQAKCGIPDISYHGENAWQTPSEVSSRLLGVYYSGAGLKTADCFVAYNMHWEEHKFALPALAKKKKWYKVMSTVDGVAEIPEKLESGRFIEVKARTIMVLVAADDIEDKKEEYEVHKKDIKDEKAIEEHAE